ncbi:hypothetical protein EXIGLDRAFT_765213 [Exidia glandulosa HHB12029]|uniref:Protein kinase domain-containing protein n=1 Tax=Exidia glandulosa HHB12029 TaxID=1314781 RepID=A0A165KLN8_EXIGL|nr:hypothetical protein EXIGLDRAFT_765213 [Exidia glandulosa HHB12029]
MGPPQKMSRRWLGCLNWITEHRVASTLSSPMSTSLALIKTNGSPWKASALGGASLALRIAKEAASDVPIVKQIVGVALNIVELAEKAEKNRDAMRMLAEKAATLAQLVKQVVSDRTVDGQLVPLLERLTLVFGKVEAFMLKETAKGNGLKKIYRSVFVLQSKVEKLSNELETEIHGFAIATFVDTRVYMAETRVYMEDNAQHDGQFRRLRDYEVRKLAVIAEHETDHGRVTYAQARVDGVSEIMVVKYLKGAVKTGQMSDAWSMSMEDVLTQVSSLELSHPNVAQFYGRGVRDGRTQFLVLRTGAYPIDEYFSQARASDNKRFQEYFRMWILALAASAHLEGLGIAWFPQSLGAILVDNNGQPCIGTFDDLVSSERCSRFDQAVCVLWVIDQLRLLAAPAQVHCIEAASPASCDNGLLKACMESNTSFPPILHRIWARICTEELYVEITMKEEPFPDFSQLSPVAVLEAVRLDRDLWSYQYPPIQQEQRSAPTNPEHNNEPNDSKVDDESLEVDIKCRLQHDVQVLSGHYILHGFHVALHYCTETGFTNQTYLIDLPPEVTAEVCMILYEVDDPQEALDLFSTCEFFDGVARIPLALL